MVHSYTVRALIRAWRNVAPLPRCMVWFAFLFIAVDRASAAGQAGAGPLFDTFSLTLTPGKRTEIAGPCFYSERTGSQRTWAVPAVVSRLWDPETDYDEVDVGFPLMTYRRFGTEYRWQFLQVFSYAGGEDQRQTNSQRLTLFPIYFQQRSPDTNLDYTAVAPFYGHLRNRLFRDDIFFVMFPLYGQSRKKDVVTDNYLYPFVHIRRGDGLEGWQVWPLLGHEHKEPTTATNGFGDTEVVAGHDNRFFLWPICMLSTSGTGTTNLSEEKAFLPFYTEQRSPLRDSTVVLWPFFSRVTDRERKFREWDAPWPLIVFARGEGKTTTRVWPFYSRAENANLRSDFLLWPLYKYNRVHVDALERERTRILFFLYSDKNQRNTQTGEHQRRIDVWPLFTRTRDYAGNTRLQVFSMLEPLLPDSMAVERDLSQLWSVWRAEANPRTGCSSQSLLWNLFRRDAAPRSSKVSILFGLVQVQSGAEGSRLRLFYGPSIRTRSAEATTGLSFGAAAMK